MALVRQHVWVSGKVQGVCYRSYAQQEARNLGVKGWVRNLADGRVEAVFEGEEAKVNSMRAWCQNGSPWAKVTGIRTVAEEWVGETSFDVVA